MTEWAICYSLFSGVAPVTFGLYTYPHSVQPQRGAAIGRRLLYRQALSRCLSRRILLYRLQRWRDYSHAL